MKAHHGVWILATLTLACGGHNRLADYDYPNRTLAIVSDFPPYPEVLTGPYFPGHSRDPIHAMIRVGSRIAKEVEAREARARLDSAAKIVDVAGRLSHRAGERASRFLRTRLIDDQSRADFVLQIRIKDYGIDAEEWDAAANFFVEAHVVLLDGSDGREIWKTHVRDRDAITPAIVGPSTIRNIVTASAFAGMTVADASRALEQLADYSADHITERLREALNDARRME